MIANYHTHTWRCNHAVGTEEEYVQAAIERGLSVLGFSDHAPYCFPDGYYSGFRMKPEQAAGYSAVIRDLRSRFQPQLEIHLGAETEYYPSFFADTVSMLRDHQVEYLILGQHFPGNEIGEAPASARTEDEKRLEAYCRQMMEAMNTGLFSYVAHPDMFRFVGEPAVYHKHIRRLCREANSCGMPLEINLLGMAEERHYPNPLFWQIAAEEGCAAIIGCDAHKPESLLDTQAESRALKLAADLGINVLEKVTLRQI